MASSPIPQNSLLRLISKTRITIQENAVEYLEYHEKPAYNLSTLRSHFKQAIIRRTLDIIDAIVVLVKKKNHLVANSLCRELFELYLVTRFVLSVDTFSCYDSYFRFVDFQKHSKLLKMNVNQFSDEDTKAELVQILAIHEKNESIALYVKSTMIFADECRKKYDVKDLDINLHDDNWWCGLKPWKMAKFIGGDVVDFYTKKYWGLSNLTHPSPEGSLLYLSADTSEIMSFGEEALVFAINFSVKIGQFVIDDQSVVHKLQRFLNSVERLIKKFYEIRVIV